MEWVVVFLFLYVIASKLEKIEEHKWNEQWDRDHPNDDPNHEWY